MSPALAAALRLEDDGLRHVREITGQAVQEEPDHGVFRWRWLPDAGRLEWPASLTALLGEPPEPAESWDVWLQHVHPADLETVQRVLDPAGDMERRVSYRVRLADGRMEWIEDRRRRLPDGQWSGVFIRMGETQGGLPEPELQRRAEKVMSVAGIGIVFRDFCSGEEYCNDTLCSLLGVETNSDAARYDALADLVHPDDAAVFRRMIADRRRNGGFFDLDYRIVMPSGEIRWVRERGQYESAPGGEVLCYYGAVRDITPEKRRAAELNTSRMRLKLALEVNAVAVWEYNSLTAQPFWSDEYYRLLGYEPRSVPAGRAAWLAIVHPEDRIFAQSSLHEMFTATEVSELTYRIIAHGRERWIRDTWSWGRDAAGQALICYGLTTDITDLKLREHRLIAAERWLQMAVDSAGLGIWEHDLETGEYLWNDRMFHLLDYVSSEVRPTSESWIARIHPDDRPKVNARVQSARFERTDFTLEYRLLLPGNVIRWVEERGRITFRGSAARHHGVLFDVSQRKALELRLFESHERLKLALETGDMGFWSGGGADQQWDKQAYAIQGLARFAVPPKARHAMRLVHPQDRDYLRATIARARASGEVVAAEYRIIRPDGAVRWIESRFCIGGPSARGRYGVLRDITDRKVREEYYLKSQRLEAAGQLLGGIVHDFNNLLAVIAATLERVERHTLTPEIAQHLAHAREAAHAGGLFNRRLINLSQLRRQQPQPLCISERIAVIMGVLHSVMKPGIKVSTRFPDDLWNVLADPLDLESAVINLVINARDAIKGDGEILITAGNEAVPPDASRTGNPPGDHVVLTIRDTGCGMDKATLARATEPFFSTKPEGAGTGLGLTSVSAFAANVHGYMTIASAPGEGTSVSLHIPRTRAERATARTADAGLPMGDGELVLVVDDDTAVREGTLQRVEALGYSVEAAAHAGEAISKLLSMPSIALVLSDIAMPGDLNGFGLRDWVAAEMPHVPVLLISAHEHFLSEGAPDARGGPVLAKSCSRRQLAQALNGALAGEA